MSLAAPISNWKRPDIDISSLLKYGDIRSNKDACEIISAITGDQFNYLKLTQGKYIDFNAAKELLKNYKNNIKSTIKLIDIGNSLKLSLTSIRAIIACGIFCLWKNEDRNLMGVNLDHIYRAYNEERIAYFSKFIAYSVWFDAKDTNVNYMVINESLEPVEKSDEDINLETMTSRARIHDFNDPDMVHLIDMNFEIDYNPYTIYPPYSTMYGLIAPGNRLVQMIRPSLKNNQAVLVIGSVKVADYIMDHGQLILKPSPNLEEWNPILFVDSFDYTRNPEAQYRKENIDLAIKKLSVGFTGFHNKGKIDALNKKVITGTWGAYNGRGDPQLSVAIQILVFYKARILTAVFCIDDPDLREIVYDFLNKLDNYSEEIAETKYYNALINYAKTIEKNGSFKLLDFFASLTQKK